MEFWFRPGNAAAYAIGIQTQRCKKVKESKNAVELNDSTLRLTLFEKLYYDLCLVKDSSD